MDYLNRLKKEVKEALRAQQNKKAVFDDTMGTGAVFSAEDDASAYEITDVRLQVAGAVAAFIETTDADLDEGETLADRMDALLMGICDTDKNGEIDDDELAVLEMAYNALDAYLIEKGASEEDVSLLIDEGDGDAAERIHELLVNTFPSGDDEVLEEIDRFGFDRSSDESVMDAAYKKRIVIRNGRKAIIRKRVSGKVRLTSRQRMGIAKMHRKSHSGAARMKRARSMKRRRSMGL